MNESPAEKATFDTESLRKLTGAEGKTVKAVICYLWHNAVNAKDVVELIDNIEFVFSDATRLTFGSNEDNTGLVAVDFDYEREKKEVEQEFGGKIRIYAVDASATSMWKDVIGQTLRAVKLTKENDKYLSDSVLMDFGTQQRTISVSHVDGLIADFWEE